MIPGDSDRVERTLLGWPWCPLSGRRDRHLRSDHRAARRGRDRSHAMVGHSLVQLCARRALLSPGHSSHSSHSWVAVSLTISSRQHSHSPTVQTRCASAKPRELLTHPPIVWDVSELPTRTCAFHRSNPSVAGYRSHRRPDRQASPSDRPTLWDSRPIRSKNSDRPSPRRPGLRTLLRADVSWSDRKPRHAI